MAKIGKMRFVNFTYNENRHIYDQTLDFYQGEDTLLNLQNGGGKTVLVQMMMQPIIPKQKLKDRLFKSYFSNAKAPVYIMLEWVMDDAPFRLLTGMGIKRVAGKDIEDEGSLKVVTFLAQYERGSRYDIERIELTQEEKGIVKLIDFDRVVKGLSEAEKEGNAVWVFRWQSSEDKKEYTRRLLEYKINPSEWKNLMVKINEAEAGLNSFFNDCKTNKALLKKWFLPTIEEQLNKNGNCIENIKELMQNHVGQLVKNEDVIKERKLFDGFKSKSAELVKRLEAYQERLEQSKKNQMELGNAYRYVEEGLKQSAMEKEETKRLIQQAETALMEIRYQKLSGDYYSIEDVFASLKEEELGIAKEIEEEKKELEALEHKEKRLLYRKLEEECKSLNEKIAKYEVELEKEALQQEDVKTMVNDLRYSLKEKYHEKLLQGERLVKEETHRLEEEERRFFKCQEACDEYKQEISLANERWMDVQGRLRAFQESERTLKERYQDLELIKKRDGDGYAADVLNGVRERVEEQEAEAKEKLLAWQNERLECENQLSLLEEEAQSLREDYPNLAVIKDKKESAWQSFQSKKQEMEQILRAYQLNEDWLFDKERIRIPLQAEQEKYQNLINQLNLENSIESKRLKQYESGKTFELSDELKKALEDKDVYVEFGHDWLRDLAESKRDKLKLVKNNPFLPYSLIVTKKDFELIKELKWKGSLSPVVPILERESLEDVLLTKTKNHVYTLEGVHFLIPFDDRVLNHNYLVELCGEISSNLEKNNALIRSAQEALGRVTEAVLKVEGFAFTKQKRDELRQEMEEAAQKWEECEEKLRAAEDGLRALKERERVALTSQNEWEGRKEDLLRKKGDVLAFIAKCERHAKDWAECIREEERIKEATASRTDKEKERDQIRARLQELSSARNNLSSALEREKLQYQKYSDANTGKRMEGEIESLEAKLAAYTSKMSGKIQTLQEVLDEYRHQREDKKKAMGELGVGEEPHGEGEYREATHEAIKKESKERKERIKEREEARNEVRLAIAERTSELKYKKQSIREQCERTEPMPREDVKDMDYEREEERQKNVREEWEGKQSQLKKKENRLQRIRFGLEEYRDFAGLVEETWPIGEKLEAHILRQIKEYKANTAKLSEDKSAMATRYAELENAFAPQAELFKNLFRSILNEERRFQPGHALNAFERVYMQIDRKLEQYEIDIQKMEGMERYIIENALSYLKNVYDELKGMDRNSVIPLEGKRCKMLVIGLPEKEELETASLKEYLKATMLTCVDLCKEGKSMEHFLANEISTYSLFDRFVGINKIAIHLMKIEPNKLRKKTWRQVIAENSGGELFVSAFVVFISLLTYMRGESVPGTQMESKVLIMDNPFGPITSEHLLKPLFEISKKYNTQLICLTDVKGHAIYDRFNLIYSLNIEREVGREEEYIEVKAVKKEVSEEENEVLSASMFKIEDKSRFELVN